MTPAQALNNLDQAVKQVNASRDVHQLLIESIKVLQEAIKNEETPVS